MLGAPMAPPPLTPQARASEIRRVTAATLAANLGLSATKLFLGALTANQALFADGIHSLSDALTDGLVLLGAPLWSAPPDENHPHGHGRIETFTTLIIGVVLAAVGFGLIWRAFETFLQPHPPQHGTWVFAAALLSVGVNEGLYRWSVRVGRRIRAPVLIANAWHHRSDGLSSIPVALSVVLRFFRPEWTFVDPLAAMLVSLVVLKAAWDISKDAVYQLIDGAASKEALRKIELLVREHPEVRDMHALRSRHIGSGLQVDLHIQVAADLTVRQSHNIAHDISDALVERGPDVANVLVHVEPDDGHPPD